MLGMLTRRKLAAIFALPRLLAQQKMFADAEAYQQFMGRWSRLLAPLFLDFAGTPSAGQFLDVGSGTGELALALAARQPQCRALGIDPSKEYVAFASSRSPDARRVNFETGDAQQLRFTPSTFDACLSLLVFNFIPDPARALRELIRVTKPGGPIAAAVWDYGGQMRMLRLFWDAAVDLDPGADSKDERHMPLCRAGELSALWTRAGLTQVEEKPLDFTMRFSSFSDYWDPFLLGQGPAGAYTRQLDAKRQAALRDELKRRLDPSLALPARAWAVRGLAPLPR